jgi:hypothetical protein
MALNYAFTKSIQPGDFEILRLMPGNLYMAFITIRQQLMRLVSLSLMM